MLLTDQVVGVGLPVAVVHVHHPRQHPGRRVGLHLDRAHAGEQLNHVALFNPKARCVLQGQIGLRLHPQAPEPRHIVQAGMQRVGNSRPRAEDEGVALPVNLVERAAVGGQGIQVPLRVGLYEQGVQLELPALRVHAALNVGALHVRLPLRHQNRQVRTFKLLHGHGQIPDHVPDAVLIPAAQQRIVQIHVLRQLAQNIRVASRLT